jgi:hypothetical protein
MALSRRIWASQDMFKSFLTTKETRAKVRCAILEVVLPISVGKIINKFGNRKPVEAR